MTEVMVRDPGTRRKRGRVRRTRRRAALVGAAAMIAAGLGVGVQYLATRESPPPEPVIGSAQDGRQFTTLVAMTLQGDLSQQAESLMLFGVERDGTEPVVLFIPVNTLSEVPGQGSVPIGKALTFGREGLLETTVENLLGIVIDRTVTLDDVTIGAIVDELGGIEVTVDERLLEEGDDGLHRVAFPLGLQRMDGATAATYLTFRGIDETELSRFPRAQQVWEGIFGAAPDPATLAAASRVARADGAADDDDLANLLVTFASASERAYEVMPPEAVGAGGEQEAFVPDPTALRALIARAFAGSLPPPGPWVGARVEIRNGNGTPEVGEEVAAALVPAGLTIVVSGNARSFDFASTRVVVYGDDEESLAVGRYIVELLGVGEVEIGRRGQTVADVTVVVGRDFTERKG